MHRTAGSRSARDVIDRWGRLGSVEQARATTDYLDLADGLRQRKIIERRKPDPIGHERNAVLQNQGVFGLLWIAEASVTNVEFARRLLLGDQHTRRIVEGGLEVVVDNRRLLIE